MAIFSKSYRLHQMIPGHSLDLELLG
jgi:hypothetical protein